MTRSPSERQIAVAVEDGLVVGFVSAVHYVHPDKSRPELWINEVSVAATHRRRGLGTRLLHSVFDVGRCLGCAEAWVLTDRANTAAMRLYSAGGSAESPTDTRGEGVPPTPDQPSRPRTVRYFGERRKPYRRFPR